MIGSGKPTQLPEEAVRSLPVNLVPETTGFRIAERALVVTGVEALNLTAEPSEFAAVIRATRYLPTVA